LHPCVTEVKAPLRRSPKDALVVSIHGILGDVQGMYYS
jgi:hypothetical protein